MILKRQNIIFFLVSLLIATFIFALPFETSFAKTKAKKSDTKQTSKKSTKPSAKIKSSTKEKSKTKKKGKKRRRVRRPPFRETNIKMTTPLMTVSDSVLAEGVVYHNYLLGGGKFKHNLHVVELDAGQRDARIGILKANMHFDGLQKLQEMNKMYDSLSSNEVLASVNGNFWRAITNYPIGPTASNGEVVEMNIYKQWTSGLLDENGMLYINNFIINGTIITKTGELLDIKTVNRRKGSEGVCVYNHFAGDSIPYTPLNSVTKEIKKVLAEVEMDLEFTDSTDDEIDTTMIKEEIFTQKNIAKIEHNLPKFSAKYLEKPCINKAIPCVVTKFSESTIAVPKHGCVISLGTDIPRTSYPSIGDTIYLKYETDDHKDVIFTAGVCGTPRLVRNGIAKPEAEREGSHGGRFIKWQLPRTAIGTDFDGGKIFLVTVAGTGSILNGFGANLSQLSLIMKRLGCFNAMNLDGGGSSIMVINNKNIMLKSRPEASRRLSVGVGVVRKK